MNDLAQGTAACTVCGRHPAARFAFQANSGYLVFRRVHSIDTWLCLWCGEGTYRSFQTRNITRGPWGVVSLLAAIGYMISNASRWAKAKAGLQPPPPISRVDEERLRGKPVLARPAVWASVAILAGVLFFVFKVATASESATPTWSVGNCAAYNGDLAYPIACDSPLVAARIVAIRDNAINCPDPAEAWVEFRAGQVACLDE